MMKDMGVEYVIESTGLFVEAEKVLLFKKILLLMAVVFAKKVHTLVPQTSIF
jgi:glyceraldehyde-3-phosphate dehydrogenase/erythrose-4-phosphate dehydrogenase